MSGWSTIELLTIRSRHFVAPPLVVLWKPNHHPCLVTNDGVKTKFKNNLCVTLCQNG